MAGWQCLRLVCMFDSVLVTLFISLRIELVVAGFCVLCFLIVLYIFI